MPRRNARSGSLAAIAADPWTGRVAAVHAGWRGVESGVLEAAVERYSASHPELARAAQSLLDVLNANGV